MSSDGHIAGISHQFLELHNNRNFKVIACGCRNFAVILLVVFCYCESKLEKVQCLFASKLSTAFSLRTEEAGQSKPKVYVKKSASAGYQSLMSFTSSFTDSNILPFVSWCRSTE